LTVLSISLAFLSFKIIEIIVGIPPAAGWLSASEFGQGQALSLRISLPHPLVPLSTFVERGTRGRGFRMTPHPNHLLQGEREVSFDEGRD